VAGGETPITEPVLLSSEVPASTDEKTRQAPRKSAGRRGPNRRRPRNPNYKKAENEGDSNGSASEMTSEERPAQSRSYDSDFAERVERTERFEPQPPVSVAPEPQKSATESAPKAVEE
jgi:ribonuclease E